MAESSLMNATPVKTYFLARPPPPKHATYKRCKMSPNRSQRSRKVSIMVAPKCMQYTFPYLCLILNEFGLFRSTILRILSGRHLVKPDGAVLVLGRSAFHDTRLNFERSYLDTDWGMRTVAFAGYGCPLQADIPVFGMMQKLQEEYPKRRDELLELLGVDLKWRMHQVSDGQRRRVQVSSKQSFSLGINFSSRRIYLNDTILQRVTISTIRRFFLV